ncbi:MAG TPA: hypothetical protein VMR70_06095, partial [Flavisolibacter sp.]|nr:hypothetical protein [Flavisolibacter sp.]
MKKFLPFLSGLVLLAACNTQPAESETKTLQSVNQANAIDTAGLAQFQQWKAQNELSVAAVPQQVQQTAPVEQVKTVTVIRERVIEKPAPVRKTAPKPAQTQPDPIPVEEPIQTNTGSGTDVAQNTGTSTEASEPAA